MVNIYIFFKNIEPGHTEELQWGTLISSFLDSRVAAVHSTRNVRAHTKIRVALNAVKKESKLSKWAAVKDTVLKVQFLEQNFAENYHRSYLAS